MSTVAVLFPEDHGDRGEREPTDAELCAIELQRPVLDAELELLDAEITACHQPGDLDAMRRVWRARMKVLATQLDRIDSMLNTAPWPVDYGEGRWVA